MFLVSGLVYAIIVLAFLNIVIQGNMSNQHQVSIFDPVHDSVRTALEARWALILVEIRHYNLYNMVQFARILDNEVVQYFCWNVER